MSEHESFTPHVVSTRVYLFVWVALVAGVGLQVLVSFHNLGIFNAILAVAIAVTQALIVALFSMHLKYSPKLSMLCLASAVFLLMTLFGMVLLDYYSRAWGMF